MQEREKKRIWSQSYSNVAAEFQIDPGILTHIPQCCKQLAEVVSFLNLSIMLSLFTSS